MEIQSDIQYFNYSLEIAAIDIGNSRIKMLYGSTTYSYDYQSNWFDFIAEIISKSPKLKTIGYSSVNHYIENDFLAMMTSFPDINIQNSKEILLNQTSIKYGHIQGIGSDRIFGILGGIVYSDPPFITVDCGTAITVNAVDSKGMVLGGGIFAGLFTQLKALTEDTDNLNNLYIEESNIAIGKNTVQALSYGLVLGTVGGIECIIANILKNELQRNNVTIYITGGYAKILLPHLLESKFNFILNETLVLEGILNNL